jgi:hypothetical protein
LCGKISDFPRANAAFCSHNAAANLASTPRWAIGIHFVVRRGLQFGCAAPECRPFLAQRLEYAQDWLYDGALGRSFEIRGSKWLRFFDDRLVLSLAEVAF